MKQFTILLMLLTFFNVSSQTENEGNRTANIFYPTIEKTEKEYNISVDLFELGKTKYIEAELYDEDDVKLTSRLFNVILKGNKYYLSEDEGLEKEVFIYDINFNLENPDNDLAYPKLKISLLNSNYQILDFSQKVFY